MTDKRWDVRVQDDRVRLTLLGPTRRNLDPEEASTLAADLERCADEVRTTILRRLLGRQ